MYRRKHLAAIVAAVAAVLVGVILARSASYGMAFGGMAFEQIPFALGYVDFRPGIPAWVAREAGQDFTRTFRLVGRDLRTTYPAGPYCLISTAVEPGTFTA